MQPYFLINDVIAYGSRAVVAKAGEVVIKEYDHLNVWLCRRAHKDDEILPPWLFPVNLTGDLISVNVENLSLTSPEEKEQVQYFQNTTKPTKKKAAPPKKVAPVQSSAPTLF